MSIAAMTAIWDGFRGDTEEKIVLLAIADGAGADGTFVTDPDRIAKKCSLTADQVREVLGRLVAASWISGEGIQCGDGRTCRIALERFQSENLKRGQQ